ncbi:MAG: carbohydrate kinase family protein [bacterium]|nr:carbohydrate kinase family protein [bacterium]
MKKTISIGGATYDVFLQPDASTVSAMSGSDAFTLPLGSKIRIHNVVGTCGGGASNTSVGLARLGCEAEFCGVVGDDQWGEKLMTNLRAEGVGTDCATVVEGEVSSFSIIMTAKNGERAILYDPGTNEHLHDVTFDKNAVSNTDWVYLNHIQRDTCVIEDDLIYLLAAEGSPAITWNPGGCQIEMGLESENNKKILSHTDLLLLNKEEALGFTKKETVQDAIRELIKIGVAHLCITDGGNGTIGCDGKYMYECPCLENTSVVDTTGAGDAFGCGATWALLAGESLPEAMRAGTINASSVVASIGAQLGLLTNIEMRKKLQKVHLDVGVQEFEIS